MMIRVPYYIGTPKGTIIWRTTYVLRADIRHSLQSCYLGRGTCVSLLHWEARPRMAIIHPSPSPPSRP